ncbi:hypothetical protein KM043_005775 [Ampulex compressa]|nr:hypothetical protein KM043_005775 [Ampulex compressa]
MEFYDSIANESSRQTTKVDPDLSSSNDPRESVETTWRSRIRAPRRIRAPTRGVCFQDVNPEAEDRANEVAAESQNNEVRVQFADEQTNEASPPELTPLDEIESNDDENRNKRFLNFGFGGAAGAGGAGSSAGSGNFLFDIIRLVAGSGSNPQGNSSGSATAGRTDGLQEAVPGPITRLFVIANRGISNLIQDLILRLAATSERIVNFKARLITSII